MTEQEENELIVEKLLKWERVGDADFPAWEQCTAYWLDGITGTTPTFTTWAEAGLILDALAAQTIAVESMSPQLWACRIFKSPAFAHGVTGPLAIRAAAMEYIRAAGEVGASPPNVAST